jgi:hypothetical protein
MPMRDCQVLIHYYLYTSLQNIATATQSFSPINQCYLSIGRGRTAKGCVDNGRDDSTGRVGKTEREVSSVVAAGWLPMLDDGRIESVAEGLDNDCDGMLLSWDGAEVAGLVDKGRDVDRDDGGCVATGTVAAADDEDADVFLTI